MISYKKFRSKLLDLCIQYTPREQAEALIAQHEESIIAFFITTRNYNYSWPLLMDAAALLCSDDRYEYDLQYRRSPPMFYISDYHLARFTYIGRLFSCEANGD
jgi:hypothetical protein